MKRALLILAFAAFTLTPALHAADSKYPINPALLYWQAAAQLPQLTEDQARELRDMASGQIAFDAEKAGKLLVNDGCLRLAEKAAKSTAPCDWGLPLAEDGPNTALPHMGKVQQMAGLAILKAENLFAQGKVKEGIEWLVIAHRMARHAGVGDLLISNLVQNAIETNAIRAAARHCLAWDEATRHAYAATLKTLPPLHTMQDAYRGEHVLIDWVERRVVPGGQSQHELEQLIEALAAEKAVDKEAMAAQLAPGAMQATIVEWRGLQSRMEAALGKPWTQCQPEAKALTEEAVHSPHYLLRNAIPLATAVAEKGFILATLRTMLDAALQHGPQLDEASAATYRDALEGEPLRLQKMENGKLTLLAAQQHPAGKSLSLQFGK